MNIKKTNIKTTTYKVSCHFYVDVQEDVTTTDYLQLLLYHEDFPIKSRITIIKAELIEDMKDSDVEKILEYFIDEEDLYKYYKEHIKVYIKDAWVSEKDMRMKIKDDFNILDYEDKLEESDER